MPTTSFAKPINRISTTVAQNYTPGDGVLIVTSAAGLSLNPGEWIRACILNSGSLHTILHVSGVSGNILTVDGGADGYSDEAIVVGEFVELLITSGAFSDIHTAINTLESASGGAGTGTVTSVGMTVPAEFAVTGSPVQSSGTLAITKQPEVANSVWAGPTTGGAAVPTFRALVSSDIPTITESQVSGLSTDLGLKAPLASPAFTGSPTGDASLMTVLATGSSTPRSLASRFMNQVFNVLDWGVTGLGIVDEQPAIMALLRYVSNLTPLSAGRRTIYFPAGSYQIGSATNSQPILIGKRYLQKLDNSYDPPGTLWPGITLLGDGYSTQMSSNCPTGMSEIIRFEDCGASNIEGFRLIVGAGSPVTTAALHITAVRSGEMHRIEDVSVECQRGAGGSCPVGIGVSVDYANDVAQVHFINCKARDATYAAFMVGSGTVGNVLDVRFWGCQAIGSPIGVFGNASPIVWYGGIASVNEVADFYLNGPSGGPTLIDGVRSELSNRVFVVGGGGSSRSPMTLSNTTVASWTGVTYSGNNGAPPFYTMSVAVTNGNAAIVGTNTVWTRQLIANSSQVVFQNDPTHQLYTVSHVADDTHATLSIPYGGQTNAATFANLTAPNFVMATGVIGNPTVNVTVGQAQVTSSSDWTAGLTTLNYLSFINDAYITIYGIASVDSSNTVTLSTSGTSTAFKSSYTMLATVTNGSANVVGLGTLFTKTLSVNSVVAFLPDTTRYVVSTITDDTHITLTTTYAGTSGQKSATLQGGTASVTMTGGSATVTGSGFSAIFVRDALVRFSNDSTNTLYTISVVNSNTTLTLTSTYGGSSGAATAYLISGSFKVVCPTVESYGIVGRVGGQYHLQNISFSHNPAPYFYARLNISALDTYVTCINVNAGGAGDAANLRFNVFNAGDQHTSFQKYTVLPGPANTTIDGIWPNSLGALFDPPVHFNDTVSLNVYNGMTSQYQQLGGGMYVQEIANPTAAITLNAVIGSNDGLGTYYYWYVVNDLMGHKTLVTTTASAAITGPSVLSSSDYINLNIPSVAGAVTYDILRNTTNNVDTAVSIATAWNPYTLFPSFIYSDQSMTTAAYTLPTRNTTGDITCDGVLTCNSVVLTASSVSAANLTLGNSGDNMTFFGGTPVARPTGSIITALGTSSGLGLVSAPTIAESDVTNLVSDLAAKAPINSPTFTGTPLSTTPSTADNTTKIATTAYVKAQGYTAAPFAESQVTGLVSDLAAKAPVDSPSFSGTPLVPTAAVDTNTLQAASTAFVVGQGYAKLDSPHLTGTPLSITPSNADSSTKIATTAYVLSTRPEQLAVPLAALNMNGQTISSLGTPSVGTDAATKTYVDNAISGFVQLPPAIVTTGTATLPAYSYNNGTAGVGATLTGSSIGILTIDGHPVVLNDVVLVLGEVGANAKYNGLYKCTTEGTAGVAYVLTRHTAMDQPAEFAGSMVAVNSGTTYISSLWFCTQTVATVGTDPVSFIRLNSATTLTPGSGIDITANTVSVAATYAGGSSIATVGTVTSGTWNATEIAIAKGGTGATTKAAGFDALSPMSTLGDITYGGTSGTGTRLAGNTNAGTTQYLASTPSGSTAQAPVWQSIAVGDLPTVTIAKGGTGQTTSTAAYNALAPYAAAGDLIYGTGSHTSAVLSGNTTATNKFLTQSSANSNAPGWAQIQAGDLPTVPIGSGGTGQTTASAALGSLWPTTAAVGDVIYCSATGTPPTIARLAGNITTTNKFLTQTGNASISAAPVWNTIAVADLPTVTIAKGGTGGTSKAAGFDGLSPMSTLGDMIYGGTSGTGTRLPGYTTSGKAFLNQTGTGTASATPSWNPIATGDLPTIPIGGGGTGQTTRAAAFNALSPIAELGDTIYGSGVNTASVLSGNQTTTMQFLTQTGSGSASAAPVWHTLTTGDLPTIPIDGGGTGQVTALAAYDALSPATALGDLVYQGASTSLALAGNTTATRKFLRQTGTGSASAAPAWDTILAADVPAAGSTTQVTYNSGGVSSGSTNMVFDGTNLDVLGDVLIGTMTGTKATGCFYTSTANAAVSNTTATLIGSGVGTLVLPVNFLTAGKTILLRAKGFVTTSSSPGTSIFIVQLTSSVPTTVVVANTNAGTGLTPVASMTAKPWSMECLITCRTTGSSGTVMAVGEVRVSMSATTGISAANNATVLLCSTSSPVTATINTTLTETIDFRATASSNGTTWTCTNFQAFVVN